MCIVELSVSEQCVYIVSWRTNKLLLTYNLYSGTKHIPLFSQRPFHFRVCFIVLWGLFSYVDTYKIDAIVLKFFCTKHKEKLSTLGFYWLVFNRTLSIYVTDSPCETDMNDSKVNECSVIHPLVLSRHYIVPKFEHC